MQFLSGVVLQPVCCETEERAPLYSFIHADTSYIYALRQLLPWVCSMWGMCEGHSHSSQVFSNDRVDVWELITHEPSVLRFPRCTRRWEGRQPHVSLSVFSPNISCLMPTARKKWAHRPGQTPLLLSSCMHPLFFPFRHHLFLSLFRPAHHSSQTLLNCFSVSRNKSAVNALPLIFFFFY